jgi:hypothetical protein
VHNFIEIINVNQVTLISFCIRIKENLLSVSLYSSVSLVGSIEKRMPALIYQAERINGNYGVCLIEGTPFLFFCLNIEIQEENY